MCKSYGYVLRAMRRPVLVRRREIWFPTAWGWLLMLVVGAVILIWAGRHAHSFLAPNKPSGARLLVVEGWMPPDQLDQAVNRFNDGGYERVITTGGPIDSALNRFGHSSHAELAKDYLVQRGLSGISVSAVSAPASNQNRTFLTAVMVRQWLAQSGPAVDAFDVLSSGVHSRRSWALYRLAFGSRVRIGVLAARPTLYDPDAWWKTSAGAKTVLSEALGWFWTEVFFWPGAPDSHEKKWGEPQPASPTETRFLPAPARDAGTNVR